MRYVSVRTPGLTLDADDVFECDTCDGEGWDDCRDCEGTGLLHGYKEVQPNVYVGQPAEAVSV